MKNEKFIFEVAVEGVPHTPKTSKEIFGGDYFNPDFGIESHASDLVGQVLTDAYIHTTQQEIKYIIKCNCEEKDMTEEQNQYLEFLRKKAKVAEYVMMSLKFSRLEKE
jgi:hypothetical protein